MFHKGMYLRFQIIHEFQNQRNAVSKKAGIYKLSQSNKYCIHEMCYLRNPF